jgi:hypothetical protein
MFVLMFAGWRYPGCRHNPVPAPRSAHSDALGRTPRAHMDDDGVGLLVEVHVLDNRGPVDTEHPTPYIRTEQRHPPSCVLGPSISPKT